MSYWINRPTPADKHDALLSGRIDRLIIPMLASALLSCSHARSEELRELPKWEVGGGAGYLSFEHYPASNQYTHLTLPFPTFTYRGNILRADDRDGAKIYLIKNPGWTLQLGGHAFPPLDSSTNGARQGLNDLPLVIALGPQLQKKLDGLTTLKFGVYHALSLGGPDSSRYLRGAIWEIDLSWRKTIALGPNSRIPAFDSTSTYLALNLMGASQEVHELYFDVPASAASAERPRYHARSGPLHMQISLFQSLKHENLSLYFGGRLSDYRISSSRSSPLHKSDLNIAALLGMTYTFFKSKREGITEEGATGALKELEKLRPHTDEPRKN